MKTLFAILVVAALASPASAQDFKVGLDAYDRGEFEVALKQWQPLAERGDARAQFNVGVIYFNGQGVPHDPFKAVNWYSAAANQGYGPAQANLAFMYETGQGLLQNYVEAYKWSTLASRHGAEVGQARDSLAAKMTTEQIAEAERAAAAWQPLIADSASEPRRETEPQAVSTIPTQDQVREVQRQLTTLGFDAGPPDGIAGPRTHAAVRDYQIQNGLPVTGVITVEFFARLSPGNSDAEPAKTEAQDAQIATRQLKQSPPPLKQTPTTENRPVRAKDCDRLAAHPADAHLPAGVTGVAFQNIDAGRAVEACELALAANRDDPRYQLQLARSLHKADRLAEAVVYYQQAGLQGHPLAQKSLGFAYANGLGVTLDYAKASQWHHMAAEQGDSDAQHNLGYLYAGGRGVNQDFVQAHMWYNIAAAHGSAGAAEKRDLLAGRMTNRQIAEAERRALSWFDLHPESVGSQ